MNRRLIVSALAAATAMLFAPVAAAEATATQEPFGLSRIEFLDPKPAPVAFGEPWALEMSVAWSYEGFNPLTSKDGTVDISISGVDGVYANGLTINAGGAVFFAQPDDKPLLAPGDYTVTASFVPAKGTFFPAVKTKKPAHLVITAVGVTPTAVLAEDPTTGAGATITATISGDYVSTHAGPPPGTWHFALVDEANAPVYDIDVAQTAGDGAPIHFTVPERLAPGGTFTLTSSFTPAGDLADGLVVAEIPPSTVTMADGGPMGFLARFVAMPLGAFVGLIVVAIALGTAALVMLVRRQRAKVPTNTNTPVVQ
jgi:hypothetical protein